MISVNQRVGAWWWRRHIKALWLNKGLFAPEWRVRVAERDDRNVDVGRLPNWLVVLASVRHHKDPRLNVSLLDLWVAHG